MEDNGYKLDPIICTTINLSHGTVSFYELRWVLIGENCFNLIDDLCSNQNVGLYFSPYSLTASEIHIPANKTDRIYSPCLDGENFGVALSTAIVHGDMTMMHVFLRHGFIPYYNRVILPAVLESKTFFEDYFFQDKAGTTRILTSKKGGLIDSTILACSSESYWEGDIMKNYAKIFSILLNQGIRLTKDEICYCLRNDTYHANPYVPYLDKHDMDQLEERMVSMENYTCTKDGRILFQPPQILFFAATHDRFHHILNSFTVFQYSKEARVVVITETLKGVLPLGDTINCTPKAFCATIIKYSYREYVDTYMYHREFHSQDIPTQKWVLNSNQELEQYIFKAQIIVDIINSRPNIFDKCLTEECLEMHNNMFQRLLHQYLNLSLEMTDWMMPYGIDGNFYVDDIDNLVNFGREICKDPLSVLGIAND